MILPRIIKKSSKNQRAQNREREMMRRCLIRSFGTKPLKKRNTPIAIHASQRPEPPIPDNFDALGLEIKPIISPEILIERSFWSPPPNVKTNYPFMVDRTGVGKALPIYTDYVGGNTKVVTILRKCKGDIALLKSEMEKVVGKQVQVKPGKLIVVGNYSRRLKLWLASLGF